MSDCLNTQVESCSTAPDPAALRGGGQRVQYTQVKYYLRLSISYQKSKCKYNQLKEMNCLQTCYIIIQNMALTAKILRFNKLKNCVNSVPPVRLELFLHTLMVIVLEPYPQYNAVLSVT